MKIGRLYPLARRIVVPIFHRLWDITVEGLEHVPDCGGAIFCPNHTSVIDSFFLPAVLPRLITFVGKAEYMEDRKSVVEGKSGAVRVELGGLRVNEKRKYERQ